MNSIIYNNSKFPIIITYKTSNNIKNKFKFYASLNLDFNSIMVLFHKFMKNYYYVLNRLMRSLFVDDIASNIVRFIVDDGIIFYNNVIRVINVVGSYVKIHPEKSLSYYLYKIGNYSKPLQMYMVYKNISDISKYEFNYVNVIYPFINKSDFVYIK